MLLQTNSYIVPREKRAEHSRIIRRFRQTLIRLGCDHFEVYEQVGPNWSNSDGGGRFVQILRFADRKQQQAVQAAERTDPTAQAVIAEFCELINFPYQQQQGLFAVGFYNNALAAGPKLTPPGELPSSTSEENGVLEEPEAQADAEPVSLVEEPEIPEVEHEAEPAPIASPQTHAVSSSSDDEFEDLMVDELEDSDDAGGFLADEELEIEKPINGLKPIADDNKSTHPAHAHKAKNRPMGW